MTDRKKLGALGEEIAAEVLKNKGYYLIARNYTCPYGEVDIVAANNQTLAFVEVKTRTSQAYGSPAEAVDCKKQKRIKNAARYFLTSSRKRYENIDFQVMEIYVSHIEGLQF